MTHTLHIEKIIHGGRGIGRLENGIVALVPFVLPDEKVLVRQTGKKRGYIEAEPVAILKPSPKRTSPPCPLYTECGGCDFQHMNITAQHAAKEGIIRESLQRAGVVAGEDLFRPIIPSPSYLHYRSRVRLKVSPEGVIGFHRAGSNTVVEVSSCPVAADSLNRALSTLSQSGIIAPAASFLKELELLQIQAGDQVYCVLHPLQNIALPAKALDGFPPSLETITGFYVKRGQHIAPLRPVPDRGLLGQEFSGSVCGHHYSLHWTLGCFSQVNAGQNENLIRLSCSLAGDVREKNILDLFCGAGNFSIPLALRGADVTGIERHRECIDRAKDNASRLGLEKAIFLDRDVQAWVIKAVGKNKKYDVIVLDPPRQGMGKAATLLPALSPSSIISISCDPATHSRDIALLAQHGYRLSSITPVDMFPQTHHIESVALLEKN